MIKVTNLNTLRKKNYTFVLQRLIYTKENTIAGISDFTGISFPTVQRAIEYGKEIGLVLDGELDDSSVGRKAQTYKINRDFCHVLAVIAYEDKLVYAGYNAATEELYKGEMIGEYNNLIDNIDEILKQLLSIDMKISVMAVAIASVVDKGIIVDCIRNKSLCGFNFVEYFANKYNIKVAVDNDLKVLAAAERAYNRRNHLEDFAVVNCGCKGYGVSLVVNGEILRGRSSLAGEICYMRDMFAHAEEDEICKRFILSVVSMYAPNKIFLYTPLGDEYVEVLTEYLRDYVPENALPDIEIQAQTDIKMRTGVFSLGIRRMMNEVL